MDIRNSLQIGEKEWRELIESPKVLLEIENKRKIEKDETYTHRGIMWELFFPIKAMKDRYRREGYEKGAECYFEEGYYRGREETLGLKTIKDTELSRKITKLLAVMGVRFSYHSKVNRMFFSQPKYEAMTRKVYSYEIDKKKELEVKAESVEKRIISILDQAEKEIEKLLTSL